MFKHSLQNPDSKKVFKIYFDHLSKEFHKIYLKRIEIYFAGFEFVDLIMSERIFQSVLTTRRVLDMFIYLQNHMIPKPPIIIKSIKMKFSFPTLKHSFKGLTSF